MPNTSINFIKNNYVKKLKAKKILIFGISYKNEVGDIRHSPSIDLIKQFIKIKSQCHYFDPFVEKVEISGLKKIYLTNKLKKYDLIIFAVNHLKFKKLKLDKSIVKKDAYVFDLNNVLTDRQVIKIKKNNINFYSLGRDLI